MSDEKINDLLANLPNELVVINVCINRGMNMTTNYLMQCIDKNQIITLDDPIEANLPSTRSKSFEKIFTKPLKKYDYKS